MYSEKVFEHSVALMRIALGIIFFWFGALKLAGFNPVYEMALAFPQFSIFTTAVVNMLRGTGEEIPHELDGRPVRSKS